MRRPADLLKNGISFTLFGVGVALIAIGVFFWFRPPSVKQYKLLMAAGETSKTRYQLACYLARKGRALGLNVKVVDSAGSRAGLEAVQQGRIDLALVQGGIHLPKHANVRQVAFLNVEPLQLLVRPELAQACRNDLGALKGQSVNLSRPESGTYLLATAILKFAKLRPRTEHHPSGYVPRTESVRTMMAKIEAIRHAAPHERPALLAQMPDAVFLISTLPSAMIRNLVEVLNYRLVPLPYADAFSTISLNQESTNTDHIEHLLIQKAQIPAFTYGVSPAVPAKDCETIGAHQVVVANKDVPAEAIERLLTIIYQGTLNRLYKPLPLARVASEFPWHAGVLAYRNRNRPLLRAEVTETLRRVVTIAGSIMTGFLALYGLYRWRQVLRFRAYYAEVAKIESAAKQAAESSQDAPPLTQRIAELNAELDAIRSRAIDDFADGYFRGETVIVALLANINLVEQSLSTVSQDVHC